MQKNEEHEELLRHLRGIQYIVINKVHGGFGLSNEAKILYLKRAGIVYTLEPNQDRHTESIYGPSIIVNNQVWRDRDIARNDPILVDIVRQLGSKADGKFAKLKVVEIPADVKWRIAEYDGSEWIEEVHRTWG
jgi:hypothetical protein